MQEGRESFVVVGIGEVVWDIYRHGRHLGGTPSNFVIHATQLGDRGVLVSRVGDDVMGRELIAALNYRHVPVRYIQIDALRGTGNVMVTLDVQGVPSFRCSNDVAFDYLQHNDQNLALAASADAVLFSTLAQRSSPSRQAIYHFLRAASRAVKILDVNPQPPVNELRAVLHESLPLTNILKTNAAGMSAVRAALRRESDNLRRFVEFLFKKYSLKLVVLTHGENGCEVFDEHHAVKVDGLPVRVADTTGAGDAFAAGLVHKYLRGAALQEAAEFANLLGAFLTTQRGATPAFSAEQLEAFKESLS